MNKLHIPRSASSRSVALAFPLKTLSLREYFPIIVFLLLALCGRLSAQTGCLANVNVGLGDNCSIIITSETVLTGTLDPTDMITISVDGLSDTLTGCGLHAYTVSVTQPDGAPVLECWGEILAEDLTPPLLTCPEGTDEAVLLNDLQVLGGELMVDSPLFSPADYSCYQELSPTLPPGERAYGTSTFFLTSTDIYTFIGAADYDGILGLYQGDFFPEEPCRNLIAQTDDTYNGSTDEFDPVMPDISPSLRLSLTLRPGRSYTLVWTSREPEVTGGYGIAVFSDGNGRIASLSKIQVELAAELVCLDIEEVSLNQTYTYALFADGSLVLDYSDPFRIPEEVRGLLEFTGFPQVTDNCGDLLVTVYDVVEEAGDCGAWTITRTFEIADRYNSTCADPPLVSVCTQIITVRKPTLDDVVLPPYTAILECDEGFPTDGDRGGPDDNPAPEYTGYPYLSTGLSFYDLNESVCNLGATYSDEPRIVSCPGGYYFRREWTIVNWCSPDDNLVYQQYVRVGDFTGPEITFPIPDYDGDGLPDTLYQSSTAPSSCLANVTLPVADINDGNGCSGVAEVTVQVVDDLGNFIANSAPNELLSLPIGDFLLTYCAIDSCANQSCAVVPLAVRDRIAPTAVCNDALVISIGGGDTGTGQLGTAMLTAGEIDEGSSDNCGLITVFVRRDEDTDYTNAVQFTCDDVGDTVKVHLRVHDTSGNTNTCWVDIVPEDKLRPVCFPPADVTLGCVELPTVLPPDLGIAYITHFAATSTLMSELFGGPIGVDNCVVDTLVERSPDLALNDCGWGTITRRFEAWQLLPAGDVNGNGAIDIGEVMRSNNACEQVITISEVHQFTIDFPEDAAAECGEPNVPTVITEALGCDVLAVNVSDPQLFAASGAECYKYGLTYDVINWCLWDGEYTGYLLERLTEDDSEDLPADRAVEGNERPVVRYNSVTGLVIDRRHNDREGDSQLPNASPDLPDYGRYVYTQFVKVYDNSPPEIAVAAYGGPTAQCPQLSAGQFGDTDGDCAAAVSISFTLSDACGAATPDGSAVQLLSAQVDEFAVDTDGDGQINANEFDPDLDALDLVSGNAGGGYTFSSTFPVIPTSPDAAVYHALRILFTDGCGNLSNETLLFMVLDCKAPAPICINGLTATLMPAVDGGCAATLWAADFEGSPVYDCSGQGAPDAEGRFRVERYAIYRAAEVNADPDFTPDPDADRLTLTDQDDAYTVLYVYAFDEAGNYDFCETYVLVQRHEDCVSTNGTITGLITTETNVAVADVQVEVSGQITPLTLTDEQGNYHFDNLAEGSDLTVTPYSNDNPVNGVTTFDIVLISKHILGVAPLDTPYKRIAADANHSESITTLDLIQIRKLILQITTEFPDNTSWRFVPTDHVFPVPANPWEEFFPEVSNFNNLSGEARADFIAIKVGDVNGNAVTQNDL